MKKVKLNNKEWKRVVIKWIDSISYKRVWWDFIELDKEIKTAEKEDYIITTGYLFKKTNRYYYIAGSMHIEGNETVSFGKIFSIPIGCVISIEKL